MPTNDDPTKPLIAALGGHVPEVTQVANTNTSYPTEGRMTDTDRDDMNAEWAEYRKDYGIAEDDLNVAHQAFLAGWKAHRDGPQGGPLR
jgi:hypothetical protein